MPQWSGITPSNFMALDRDMITCLEGNPDLHLYLRRGSKPAYNIGDTLGVLETWCRYGGRVLYLADMPEESATSRNYHWQYANNMLKHNVKRYLTVENIELLTADEYYRRVHKGTERLYNNGVFSIENAIIPHDRWFRERKPVPPITKRVYLTSFRYFSLSSAN